MSIEKIELAGWSAKGLRCPDYEVDFTRGDGTHRVSLIQMPNGTGKTTTLKLLRAALSGHSPLGHSWNGPAIREFRKQEAERGEFVAHILHNGKRWSFRLEFDFENEEVRQFTTGPAGDDPGFNPPRSLASFLNTNFIRFFIFDGEFAHDLTNPQHHNAEQAIEALFQLRTFRRMASWANEYLEQQIQRQSEEGAGSGSTDQGLERQRNLVTRLEHRLHELEERYTTLSNEIDEVKGAISELENANKEAIQAKQEYHEQHKKADERREQAQLTVQHLTRDLLSQMRNPHELSPKFAQKMAELRHGFDRVKLPENTAREWFEELADEDICVCGRELTDAERHYIRTQADHYLGRNDVALLNQIKQEISSHIVEPYEDAAGSIDAQVSQLTEAVDHLGRCKDEVERVQDAAAQQDPEVERSNQEIRRLRQRLQNLEQQLVQFETPDQADRPEDCFNIQELQSRLKQEKKKLDRVADTAALRWKTETLTRLLKDIQDRSVHDLGEALASSVNGVIAELMPDNPVRLEGIERSLRFRSRSGASVGETLTVAYAFLTQLAYRSSYALPLVIDTPAAPIDEDIRAQIGQTLPRLVNQFIAFTISPERGSFTEGLERGADGDVQYLTLFRKSNERLAGTIGGAADRVQETDDAYLVEGRKYFNGFQDNSEYHRNIEAQTDAVTEHS